MVGQKDIITIDIDYNIILSYKYQNKKSENSEDKNRYLLLIFPWKRLILAIAFIWVPFKLLKKSR